MRTLGVIGIVLVVFLIAAFAAREEYMVEVADDPDPAPPTPEPTHYILIQRWGVYVKEAEFFRSQGGLTMPWGQKWKPVVAASIEEARRIGEQKLKGGYHAEE